MHPDSVFLIPLFIITTGIIAWLIIRFLYNLKHYDYLGNVLLYIGIAYALCFVFACYAHFRPAEVSKETISMVINGEAATGEIVSPKSGSNPFVVLVSSLFDGLKMMAAAFDRSVVNSFVSEHGARAVFAFYYVGVSFFALLATSISTILFVFKSFKAKIGNFFKSWSKKKNIYYIFSDPQVRPSMKLADELRNDKDGKKSKNIVIMYIQSSALKTQAGTEYRDALKTAGFDVRSEPFSEKLCAKIFNKHFNPQFRGCKKKRIRNVTVYGLFSNDDFSTDLAINFTKAINDENFERTRNGKKYKGNNTYFKDLYLEYTDKDFDFENADAEKVKADLDKLNHFKVFVTYQDADIDINHNFSGRTLQIVNTLSQYDMISSEFVLNNPITNFINVNEVKNCKENSLNVTFLGLGKINRPIFEKLTYAYQLWGDNKYLVNYHILDKYSNDYLEYYSNEFVNKPKSITQDAEYLGKPYLYNLDADCNGKDLTSFEVLSTYLKTAKGRNGRFSNTGFEIFIISLSNTNSDVKAALDLRQALLKIIDVENLKKTAIFVRIANELIIDNLKSKDAVYVIDQQQLSETTLGKLNLVDEDGKQVFVPIIVFGQNTTMSKYIRDHYSILNELGLTTQKSYNSDIKDETLRDIKTRVKWIQSKKVNVISNIATVYSLKTKLQIFGYKYDGNFENATDIVDATKGCLEKINKDKPTCEKGFETLYSSNEVHPLMKLAELEHNRWMATSYLYYKYGQRKKVRYFDKANLKGTNGLYTSNPSRTKHICMTTNQGLKDLYSKQTKLTFFENKTKSDEKCLKLTFTNDIQSIIDVLQYFQEKQKGENTENSQEKAE